MLRRYTIAAGLLMASLWNTSAYAQNDCNYADRRDAYLENVRETSTGEGRLVIQAFDGEPFDQDVLNAVLANIQVRETADFAITQLVRAMYFSDGSSDEQFMDVLNTIPFWLPDPTGPDRQYWSENHMIMWMSADWLLHERFGREVRPTLRQMLVKWLDVKIQYGFYEYFSPIYYPFTVGGMMNLVDFAEDDEIRAKAEQAVTRLLSDLLLKVNDQGFYFPTCGRGDMGKFALGAVGGIGTLARLVAGIGDAPEGSHIGALSLATSDMDLTDICATWTPEVNTTLHYGHPLSEARNIYGDLERQDRIIFQWSSGAYFHPLTANETMWQIGNFNLWGHEEFEPFAFAQILPASWGNLFAKVAASITRSSYIGNVEIDIFKHGGAVLTSSQDMWKGRAGYQIYPVVATVEDNPVLLRSGEVFPDWQSVPSRRSNDHLPYVDQDENVALVMYKPNADLALFGFGNKEVALKWESAAFDEEREEGMWVLGRVDDSYIAVRKHCDGTISGIPACPDGDGQTWAIVVGNESLHGSFDDFQAMIGQAVYEERWYFNWQQFRWVYYGHIIADGKDIEHHWLGNWWDAPEDPNGLTEADPGRLGQGEADGVNLYPNPARDFVTVDLRGYGADARLLYVIDNSGREMYRNLLQAGTPDAVIETRSWTPGWYTVVIENADGSTGVKRLIVAQ